MLDRTTLTPMSGITMKARTACGGTDSTTSSRNVVFSSLEVNEFNLFNLLHTVFKFKNVTSSAENPTLRNLLKSTVLYYLHENKTD